MMRVLQRAVMAVLAAYWMENASGEVPVGWTVAGSTPQDYVFTRDSNSASSGHYSALIAAKPGVSSAGFGTLMQTISAENYRGGRWRLSGYLKTQAAGRAQMWMRVDGPDRKVLSFDNMDSRPVTGDTDWTRYAIVLDVPQESVDLAFGFFLVQRGQVWGDDFRLDKVDERVALTAVPTGLTALPKQPVNVDFENNPEASYKAETIDVYDMYRLVQDSDSAATGTRLAGRDGRSERFASWVPSGREKFNLCGMHVSAQTRTSNGGSLLWDFKISVVKDGKARVAGISAGSFAQAPNAGKRIPRSPITSLAIQLKGGGAPVSAAIQGAPNADHGVVGMLPEADAEQLFDALNAGTPVTLDIKYASGDQETLRLRTTGLAAHRSYPSDPVARCLLSLVPSPSQQSENPILEVDHPLVY